MQFTWCEGHFKYCYLKQGLLRWRRRHRGRSLVHAYVHLMEFISQKMFWSQNVLTADCWLVLWCTVCAGWVCEGDRSANSCEVYQWSNLARKDSSNFKLFLRLIVSNYYRLGFDSGCLLRYPLSASRPMPTMPVCWTQDRSVSGDWRDVLLLSVLRR